MPRRCRCEARHTGAFACAAAAGAALVLCSAMARAQAWRIVPSLSVSQTYTDNLRLAASGSEQEDWVTTLGPSVSVSASGGRMRLNAMYAPQLVRRWDDRSQDLIHLLNATGNAELLEKSLYLDAAAVITQQNISLAGPQSEGNINVSANRTSVRTTRLSPYYVYRWGSTATGEARLAYSTVTTGATTGAANSQVAGANLRLASGPAFRLMTWNLFYDRQQTEYSQTSASSVTTERIQGQLRRLITPAIGLIATAGFDNNSYTTAAGTNTSGMSWSLGADWNPTPRTRLSATLGRRYYGRSKVLDFSHRTRLTVWTANYSDDVTTTVNQLLVPSRVDAASYLDTLFLNQYPDPVERQRAVADYIARNGLPPTLNVPLTALVSVPYLVRRFQASFGVHGARNTVLATVFTQTAGAVGSGTSGTGDFAGGSTTTQRGLNGNWTWRIGPLTSSNLNLSRTRSGSGASALETTQTLVRASLTRQFAPKFSGAVSLRRNQLDSSQAASYRENALTATAQMSF